MLYSPYLALCNKSPSGAGLAFSIFALIAFIYQTLNLRTDLVPKSNKTTAKN